MKIAYITDELTQRFDEALAFAIRHKMDGLELRSVEGQAIDEIDTGQLKAWRTRLDEHGLSVPVLSSSFYKCDINDRTAVEADWAKLERLCERAKILGSRYIRGFGFFSAGDFDDVLPRIVALYQKPLEILEEQDQMLLLEADPSVNGSNHGLLSRLIEAIGSRRIGAIYDPGNDIYDPIREVPYPDGYEAIQAQLRHIHIKDAVMTDRGPECVKIGTGLVDYPGLLRRLLQDNYDGWLSLETHYRAGTELTEEQMRIPKGADFSAGGLAAMEESLLALRKLIYRAHGSN